MKLKPNSKISQIVSEREKRLNSIVVIPIGTNDVDLKTGIQTITRYLYSEEE